MEKRGILDWPLVCVQLLNRCWGGGGGLVVKGKSEKIWETWTRWHYKSGPHDLFIKNIKFDIFDKHHPSRHNSFPKSLYDTKET